MTGCCCWSTTPSTPWDCAPSSATCWWIRAELGAELVKTDRGGDVTYHGPGQLTGYPIVSVAMGHNAIPCHVHAVEQLVIDALGDLGLAGAGRLSGLPGVWLDPNGARPRKIAAVGVRVTRGRSMHGFALNVDTDLERFDRIVPCGIADKGVTSLHAEGLAVSMREVVDAVAVRAAATVGRGGAGRRRGRPPGHGLAGATRGPLGVHTR